MDFDEIKDNNEISEEVSSDVESTDVESTDEEIASDNKMKKSTAALVVAISILVTLCLSVVGTIVVMNSIGYNALGLSYENWNRLKWGFSVVDEIYYEKIDENQLVDGALMGLSLALDEYSMYMPLDSADDFMTTVNAENYCGVGMHVYSDTENNCVKVMATLPGSPAEKAGLNSEDIIKTVDGEEVGADVNKASSLLMGEKGTTVKVQVQRADSGEIEIIEITRDEIKQDVVKSEIITENVGYIQLTRFGINTYNSFVDEFNKLTEKGMEKLILDLRDNPGGYFNSAAQIAEIFLDKGDLIISTKDSRGHITEFRAATEGNDMEVVILCNENTASASEVLTAALRDNGRAKVIGTKTYGKGVTQAMVSYHDGSMFKITDTRYYTPKDVCIDKKGIKPDIKVSNDKNSDKDMQLETAIEELL